MGALTLGVPFLLFAPLLMELRYGISNYTARRRGDINEERSLSVETNTEATITEIATEQPAKEKINAEDNLTSEALEIESKEKMNKDREKDIKISDYGYNDYFDKDAEEIANFFEANVNKFFESGTNEVNNSLRREPDEFMPLMPIFAPQKLPTVTQTEEQFLGSVVAGPKRNHPANEQKINPAMEQRVLVIPPNNQDTVHSLMSEINASSNLASKFTGSTGSKGSAPANEVSKRFESGVENNLAALQSIRPEDLPTPQVTKPVLIDASGQLVDGTNSTTASDLFQSGIVNNLQPPRSENRTTITGMEEIQDGSYDKNLSSLSKLGDQFELELSPDPSVNPIGVLRVLPSGLGSIVAENVPMRAGVLPERKVPTQFNEQLKQNYPEINSKIIQPQEVMRPDGMLRRRRSLPTLPIGQKEWEQILLETDIHNMRQELAVMTGTIYDTNERYMLTIKEEGLVTQLIEPLKALLELKRERAPQVQDRLQMEQDRYNLKRERQELEREKEQVKHQQFLDQGLPQLAHQLLPKTTTSHQQIVKGLSDKLKKMRKVDRNIRHLEKQLNLALKKLEELAQTRHHLQAEAQGLQNRRLWLEQQLMVLLEKQRQLELQRQQQQGPDPFAPPEPPPMLLTQRR